MTQRVNLLAERDSKSDYQLPAGQQWWLCRYEDNGYVSEVLFTDESVMSWWQARQFIATEIGWKTPNVVSLYERP